MIGRRFGPLAAVLCLSVIASGAARAQEIDQLETCLACHEDIAAELTSKVPHSPASSGDCAACHNPHVSRFDSLLQERPAQLCTACHAESAGQSWHRPVVHQPVADGRCVACHEPHGGENANLLIARGSDLCSTCHSEVAEWQQRTVQHQPFATGRCANCHEPHAADHPGSLLPARRRGMRQMPSGRRNVHFGP